MLDPRKRQRLTRAFVLMAVVLQLLFLMSRLHARAADLPPPPPPVEVEGK